jgi:nitroreductase
MSEDQIELLNHVIRNRKSVFPNNYIHKEIPKHIIKQVLENANRAPTHKLTQPWRFKIVRGKSRLQLGQFLSYKYKTVTAQADFSESKYHKLLTYPTKANCVIIISMQRDSENKLPEWEEIAATAMAVQNMYLTCTANQIGCYWSSPGLLKYMNEFATLKEGERCLGLFYMGYYDKDLTLSKRSPIDQKVDWL